MAASASHLFRSGRPRSPTCRRSRSLPRCRNTCRRSGRACPHTGLRLNGKEARQWEAVMRFTTRTCGVFHKASTYQRRRPRRDPARQELQSHPLERRHLGGAKPSDGRAADRSVRVLEETPGLLVRAHFLHADLLQGGAGGVALLAVDERVGLLLVQEHCAEGERQTSHTESQYRGECLTCRIQLPVNQTGFKSVDRPFKM